MHFIIIGFKDFIDFIKGFNKFLVSFVANRQFRGLKVALFCRVTIFAL